MDITMICIDMLVGVTLALVLATLTSLFSGRIDQTLRSAGSCLLLAAVTIVVMQATGFTTPRGLEAISPIVSLSREGLLALAVIGGTLVVLGAINSLTLPARRFRGYTSSETLIGTRPQRFSGRMIRRQMAAFGQRNISNLKARHSDTTKNGR